MVIEMKRLTILLAACGLLAATACDKDSTPTASNQTRAVLTVIVQFDGEGVSGKQIDVLNTGLSGTTDNSGQVRFTLPPGRYTVRAYGINQGGPVYHHVDQAVDVGAGQSNVVKIFDCLICV